jgi:hypothetical protein
LHSRLLGTKLCPSGRVRRQASSTFHGSGKSRLRAVMRVWAVASARISAQQAGKIVAFD